MRYFNSFLLTIKNQNQTRQFVLAAVNRVFILNLGFKRMGIEPVENLWDLTIHSDGIYHIYGKITYSMGGITKVHTNHRNKNNNICHG